VTGVAPASTGQRLLWFLDHYQSESSINCPLVCRIRGEAGEGRLEAALDRLVARHESLRTTFDGRGSRLRQVVHAPARVVVRHERCSAGWSDELVEQLLDAELRTPIDPQKGPLRATVWHFGAADHLLCLNLHHLVADSWSCGVLFRELGALLEDAPPDLPRVDWQYRDFTDWQDELLTGSALDRHRAYWQRQLSGLRTPDLPVHGGPRTASGRSEMVEAVVPGEVVDALGAVANSQRTTLFAVVLATYFAALHRRCGGHDLAVATMLANRSRPETRFTVGLLANMAMLRVRLPVEPSLADIVRKTRSTVRDALRFQELPYQLVPGTGAARAARTDSVVFQMMPEPIQQASRHDAVQLEGLVPHVGGRFDLELSVLPCADGLRAMLFHRPERCDPDWVRGFLADFVRITSAAARAPYTPISALPS